MCCPVQKAALALDCGGTVSSMEPLVYLSSVPHYNQTMNYFQHKLVPRSALQSPYKGAPQRRMLTPQP